MKDVRRILLGLAMVLVVFDAGVASAQSRVIGTINSVGTFGQDLSPGVFSTFIRVHMADGTCDGTPV
jgi:hypothetical protein